MLIKLMGLFVIAVGTAHSVTAQTTSADTQAVLAAALTAGSRDLSSTNARRVLTGPSRALRAGAATAAREDARSPSRGVYVRASPPLDRCTSWCGGARTGWRSG